MYFIEEFNINSNVCDKIVNYYLNNVGKAKLNLIMSQKNTVHKKAHDMYIENNNFEEPFKSYRDELQNCLNLYIQKYPEVNQYSFFDVDDNYKIQKYEKYEGFYGWHFENSNVERPEEINRLLVFMTYLNDVEDGGTEFKYQNIVTQARKGKTLIWPAGWTHTHRGQISKTSDKYIVTGWFTFKNKKV